MNRASPVRADLSRTLSEEFPSRNPNTGGVWSPAFTDVPFPHACQRIRPVLPGFDASLASRFTAMHRPPRKPSLPSTWPSAPLLFPSPCPSRPLLVRVQPEIAPPTSRSPHLQHRFPKRASILAIFAESWSPTVPRNNHLYGVNPSRFLRGIVSTWILSIRISGSVIEG